MNLQAAYRDNTVAVIGASGFIGRWVARELNRYGANVVLVVRNRRTAEQVFADFGVEGQVFDFDAGDRDALIGFYSDTRPSITFNLAGYGVKHDESDVEEHQRINTELVSTLAQVIAENRDENWTGQHLVHTGSALEYGAVDGDLREDTIPNPTTLYGRTKLAGTERLRSLCQSTQLKGLTARLFTVYGPGEFPQRLTPSLLRTAETGQPLQLSAGEQRRDFTFVCDVAEGLLRLGVARAEAGEVINLATGRLFSVREFVLIAADELGIPASLLRFGERSGQEGEMQHADVNVARYEQLTRWKPTVSIGQGVRSTADFLGR